MNLKNCPFCNSTDLEPADTYGYPVQVHCRDCNCYGPSKLTAEEANDAWNNRPVDRPSREEAYEILSEFEHHGTMPYDVCLNRLGF